MLLTYKATQPKSQDESKEERRLHLYETGEKIPLVAQGVWQVYKGMVQLSTQKQSRSSLIRSPTHPPMATEEQMMRLSISSSTMLMMYHRTHRWLLATLASVR
ncbi:MAG: hypothetical protein F6K10_43190, partial [Moorea sp. SIO2B7]|nr:hypothetical protein [Moorena sp. SIO2B7]